MTERHAPLNIHPPNPGPLITIGMLTRAHGLKGEIRLDYYADSLEWLDGPIWLRAAESGPVRQAKVAGMRLHHGQVMLRLEGVNDRSGAEQLRGLTVLVPESVLPESDDTSLYLHDLLGLDVLLHVSGEKIGKLAHVAFTGGQELWIIEGLDGHEILFPAVPDFVDAVDLDNKTIRVSPPPGLLELYAAEASR